MPKRLIRPLSRALAGLVLAAILVFSTIVIGAAFAKRQGPDLMPWHEVRLDAEYGVHREKDVTDLASYLQLEDILYEELHARVVSHVPMDKANQLNRYSENSRSWPVRDGLDWNRTREYGHRNPRGVILMLHGMTDGPYSTRHFASLFHRQGFYVLNMRMPGHGTVPAELARVNWQDWLSAVRLGVRHARSQAGEDVPLWILGYSNGAALALKYTLDALETTELPLPNRLVLLSPMIGVSELARVSKYFFWLGKLNFFRKSLWLDNYPEYDPHKYNSFPMNGPRQSRALTVALNRQLERLASSKSLERMPPILTFQSLVDSTVDTRAVSHGLYSRLPANGSELVLFDVNRAGVLEDFVQPATNILLEDMIQPDRDNYSIAVISNRGTDSPFVGEWRKEAGDTQITRGNLPMSWPAHFYSLSHVAMPFPPDDMVYGYKANTTQGGFPNLALAGWVGENGALVFPTSLFTRARANPFFDYVEQRMTAAIAVSVDNITN